HFLEQVALLHRIASVPEMMVRVADRQVGLERLLLDLRQPVGVLGWRNHEFLRLYPSGRRLVGSPSTATWRGAACCVPANPAGDFRQGARTAPQLPSSARAAAGGGRGLRFGARPPPILPPTAWSQRPPGTILQRLKLRTARGVHHKLFVDNAARGSALPARP